MKLKLYFKHFFKRLILPGQGPLSREIRNIRRDRRLCDIRKTKKIYDQSDMD